MKQLVCEMCGSSELRKQDGVFVCQGCGCQYSVEEAKKLMIEGVVEVAGTVAINRNSELENYLERAKNAADILNWEQSDKYAEEALIISPQEPYAWFLKGQSAVKRMQFADWKNSVDLSLSTAADDAFKNALVYLEKKINDNKPLTIEEASIPIFIGKLSCESATYSWNHTTTRFFCMPYGEHQPSLEWLKVSLNSLKYELERSERFINSNRSAILEAYERSIKEKGEDESILDEGLWNIFRGEADWSNERLLTKTYLECIKDANSKLLDNCEAFSEAVMLIIRSGLHGAIGLAVSERRAAGVSAANKRILELSSSSKQISAALQYIVLRDEYLEVLIDLAESPEMKRIYETDINLRISKEETYSYKAILGRLFTSQALIEAVSSERKDAQERMTALANAVKSDQTFLQEFDKAKKALLEIDENDLMKNIDVSAAKDSSDYKSNLEHVEQLDKTISGLKTQKQSKQIELDHLGVFSIGKRKEAKAAIESLEAKIASETKKRSEASSKAKHALQEAEDAIRQRVAAERREKMAKEVKGGISPLAEKLLTTPAEVRLVSFDARDKAALLKCIQDELGYSAKKVSELLEGELPVTLVKDATWDYALYIGRRICVRSDAEHGRGEGFIPYPEIDYGKNTDFLLGKDKFKLVAKLNGAASEKTAYGITDILGISHISPRSRKDYCARRAEAKKIVEKMLIKAEDRDSPYMVISDDVTIGDAASAFYEAYDNYELTYFLL